MLTPAIIPADSNPVVLKRDMSAAFISEDAR
jgi:hypothetical protein